MTYNPIQLGQKTMANSSPVVIASDQSTLPVSIAATVAISAASLPLPTGAATAAKQPALGTAGTASADVITVQGIASMTALKVDGSAVTQPVSGTFWQATQPVSNAGTFAVQDSQVITDNAGFTDGTSKVFMGGYIFDEVAGTALTENDAAAARIDSKRAQVLVIEDATTRGRRATVSAGGALLVDASATTQPVSGTVTASNCAGDVPSGSSDSGNPVKTGGVARTTNPTAVSDGQRVNRFHDKVGRVVTVANQCRDLVGVQQTTITSSTSETTIVTAVASTFLDLVQLTITNSSATALIVTLKDSTAGTTRGIYALAANGGITISFPTPLPQAAVNNNWTLTCGTSVASIYVVAQYVKNV